jgi:hypothetical protein
MLSKQLRHKNLIRKNAPSPSGLSFHAGGIAGLFYKEVKPVANQAPSGNPWYCRSINLFFAGEKENTAGRQSRGERLRRARSYFRARTNSSEKNDGQQKTGIK